ncbi:hypothetical protein GS466_08965 [Rhodococcus hoagii]|nr:hypothetical protein [Prescottella equi]
MPDRPADVLVEPSGSDPVPDGIENLLGLSYLSPSFYVQQFCTKVLGVDPWAWAAEKLAGDWSGVIRAANSVRSLANYNDTFSHSVRDGAAGMQSWEGDAAENARSYFHGFDSALTSQVAPLRSIADQMEQLAIAMYELSKAVGDALSSISDMAIIALVEIAAAEALAVTGVGAFASLSAAGAAALQVTRIIAAWGSVLDLWTKTWTTVQALMSGIVGTAAGAEFIDLPNLPESAYTFQGNR